MSTTRLLVIDDETAIRKLLRIGLAADGYEVIEAATGRDGLQRCARDNPAVVLLDLGLPDIDGQAVLQELRGWSGVPVIVLSVRDDETSTVAALDNGANDYMIKPFSMNELAARLRVVLRQRGGEAEGSLRIGDLEIDATRSEVTRDGEPVRLTRKEAALLRLLARHPGRVVTQRQLLHEVWGPTHTADTHYLRIYIGHLRTKLGDDSASPRLIATEPGVGYRLLV